MEPFDLRHPGRVASTTSAKDGRIDNPYSLHPRPKPFHDIDHTPLSPANPPTAFSSVLLSRPTPSGPADNLNSLHAHAIDASEILTMPGSATPPGAPPSGGPSRQRQGQQGASARRPQPPSARSSFQQNPPAPIYQQRISPPQPQDSPTPPSNPASSFYRNPSPHYQSPSPYIQRPNYPGPPYSAAPQQQPIMIHSPPHFAFPHLPGVSSPESSMPAMAYSQPQMMSMIPQPSQMFSYSGPSPENTQPPHSYGATTAAPTMGIYSPSVDPSSPAPRSPQGTSNPGGVSRQSSFVGQTGYQHMGYSTTAPAYAPPHSYSPGQPFYSSQFPPSFPPSYGSSEQDPSGAWWYLPPGATGMSYENMQGAFQPAYGLSYPSLNPREPENHSGSSTYPASPSVIRPPGSFGGSPSGPARDINFARPPNTQQGSSHLPAAPATAQSQPSAPTTTVGEVRPHPGRKPYHPNPPAHRSEWVMWAGNVPSDATQDELWRFFNQPGPPSRRPITAEGVPRPDLENISGGVSSIFLISRSNCAFINFESESHLEAATIRFNGQPLRPTDPRCPRLVCRIRKRTDDLRAGVGGQRGQGIHSKWVKDHKEQLRQADAEAQAGEGGDTDPSLSPDEATSRLRGLNLGGDEDESGLAGSKRSTGGTGHSSSGSTTSSMLTRYFPQRYFILKSLTQFDLDLSVQRGLWATQRHNEGILDQAFRTSKDVYLIFGVNKSGEFYGYARMTGPVSRGEHRVSWASPPASISPGSSGPQRPGMFSGMSDELHDRRAEGGFILPAGEHHVDESPLPVSSIQEKPPLVPTAEARAAHAASQQGQVLSAPAELRDPHHKLTATFRQPAPGLSLDVRRDPPIELDENAPIRALKNPPSDDSSEASSRKHSEPILPRSSLDRVEEEEDDIDAKERSESPIKSAVDRSVQGPSSSAAPGVESSAAEPAADETLANQDPELWGEPFKIEWIRTERLPFFRTRHLRNPWNHGREVKVSRDGTELEPGVGKALLEEWDRPPPSPSSSAPPAIFTNRPQRRGSRPPFYHPP